MQVKTAHLEAWTELQLLLLLSLMLILAFSKCCQALFSNCLEKGVEIFRLHISFHLRQGILSLSVMIFPHTSSPNRPLNLRRAKTDFVHHPVPRDAGYLESVEWPLSCDLSFHEHPVAKSLRKTKVCIRVIAKIKWPRVSRCGSAKANQPRNYEVAGSITGLPQWVKDLVLPWAVL